MIAKNLPKIIITYNWKDGTKTITLTELEEADENSKVPEHKGCSGSNISESVPPRF